MRILAVRGADIASLERFAVELREEPLRSAGLFAIVGPTGSGKSTLLDALCLALYHQVPRLDGVSAQEAKVGGAFGEIGQNDVRNLVRRGRSTCFAECDFLGADGLEYRARWGWRSGKRAGSAPQEEVSLLRISDAQVLETRKEKCEAAVVALTGLTFGQFTRTVLLAQGRFAEFLRAKEGERAELLEKLTGTELYSRVSRAAFERGSREAASRRDLEARIAAVRILSEEERSGKERGLAGLDAELPGLERREAALRALAAVAAQWRTAVADLGDLSRKTESVNDAVRVALDAAAAAKGDLDAFLAGRAAREEEIDRAVSLDASLVEQEKAEKAAADRTESVQASLRGLEAEREGLESRLEAFREESGKLDEWLGSPGPARLAPVAHRWERCDELLGRALRAREERDAAREESRALEGRLAELEPGEADLARRIGISERELEGSDPTTLGELRAGCSARIEALSAARRSREIAGRMAELERIREGACGRVRELRERRPGLLGELDATRRLAEALRLSASESVERLRETLVEGCECPVCGSLRHPRGAGAATALRIALEGHEAERRRLETGLSGLDAELARKEAEESQAVRERDGLERERAGLRLPADLAARLEADEEDVDAELSAEEGECRAGIASADRSLGTWQRLAEMRQELSELAAVASSLRQRTEACGERRVRAEASFEEAAAQLDQLFGAPAWRANWEADPVRFRVGLVPKVEEFLAKALRREELEAEKDRIGPLLDAVVSRIPAARGEADRAIQARTREAERLEALRRERRELLDGREASVARERLRGREAELSRTLEALARESSSRSSEREAHAALLEERRRRERELSDRIAAEGAALLPAGEAAEGPGGTSVRLDASLAESASALAAARKESADLRAALDLDREEADRARGLREELERGGAELRRWAALSDAIGSADGKLFRVVAQRRTLEVLLEEANLELGRITTRYGLRAIPGTLHFGVVDADSFGELRPVHTLSGGESFLVSLALALGLSRLAGGEVRVESLFVDEGFGTLDPASLRSVMSALSGLHAQGRQVGVVTHVEEMKGQIPVQVEVVRTGPGRSSVVVRG